MKQRKGFPLSPIGTQDQKAQHTTPTTQQQPAATATPHQPPNSNPRQQQHHTNHPTATHGNSNPRALRMTSQRSGREAFFGNLASSHWKLVMYESVVRSSACPRKVDTFGENNVKANNRNRDTKQHTQLMGPASRDRCPLFIRPRSLPPRHKPARADREQFVAGVRVVLHQLVDLSRDFPHRTLPADEDGFGSHGLGATVATSTQHTQQHTNNKDQHRQRQRETYLNECVGLCKLVWCVCRRDSTQRKSTTNQSTQSKK